MATLEELMADYDKELSALAAKTKAAVEAQIRGDAKKAAEEMRRLEASGAIDTSGDEDEEDE